MSDCIRNTNCLKEEHDFYSENFISDETEPSDIATEDLEDSDYKNLRIAIDTIDKLKADASYNYTGHLLMRKIGGF